MSYEELKKDYIRGWHTWNVRSVLSHVHMPDGLAINLAFKEYQNGYYLKETLIGRTSDKPDFVDNPLNIENALPGMHTFDESYTEMTVQWRNLEMRVESTTEDDDVLLLITPTKKQVRPIMLVVETGYLWNKRGYTIKDGEMITAYGGDGTYLIRSTGKPMEDLNVPTQSACLMIELDGPVAVYTGAEKSLEYIAEKIASAKDTAIEKTAKYGELAGLYQALECTMSWDTIYDAKHDRIVSPVSRLWGINSGGYVLFCWDNFFAGFMASLGCKEIAYSNLIEILNERTKKGFVPNYAYATGQRSEDRSQPPVGSAMLLETYRRFKEKWIVEDMYLGLFEWNTWFMENRMNPSGALCWGSNRIPVLFGNEWETLGVNDRFGAALESGLDNSPMYDDIPFDKENNRLLLEDVGLTGLYILDCRSLIQLAREIGREEDIPVLEERMKKAETGLEGLWDEENGFYYNKRVDTGEFSRHISPTNFYALFASSVSEERQRRIADGHYYNPEEFYGEWMLPSIARNDPAYPEQDYWRGRVWAPMNFLVYLALCNTSLKDVRKDLAEKSRNIFMNEWEKHRHVHENYNSITGEGCDTWKSDRFYHWGALLTVIAMAEEGLIEGLGTPLNEV